MMVQVVASSSGMIFCAVRENMIVGNSDFPKFLACPVDGTELNALENKFVCEQHHQFSIEDRVPIFTDAPRREDEPGNLPHCRIETDTAIDRFVNNWIVNTNGNLYWRVRGRLKRYPVPRWPFGTSKGKVVVDLGCGWGRWCL